MDLQEPKKEYKKDEQLVYSCQYHVIFCTKYRRRVLSEEVEKRLRELVLEKQQEYQYRVIEMEVMSDRVHLVLDVNPKVGIYRVVSIIKGTTSNILRKEYPELRRRLPSLWTQSRFITSVGTVGLDAVMRYIEEQKKSVRSKKKTNS